MARTNVALQSLYDLVDYSSIDPYFAALEFHPGEAFSATYYSKSPDHWDRVRARLAEVGVDRYTSLAIAPFSYADLHLAQARLKEELPIPADSNFDARIGYLELSVTDEPSPETRRIVGTAVRQVAGVDIPVIWTRVDSLLQPAVSGGRDMTTCTGGFVVQEIGKSNRGISTAAHCPNDQTYQGVALNFKSGALRENYDAQWHDSPSFTWNKTFYVQPGEVRDVTGVEAWVNLAYNEPVCKRGMITGYDCGNLREKNVCPEYVPICENTFIRVTSQEDDLAQPGDKSPRLLGSRHHCRTRRDGRGGGDAT